MKIKVQTQADKYTIGDAEIKEYTPRERTLRALKTLGAFWGLAIISVLIPVLHFILVPGFLLLGPIMAWLQYRQEIQVNNAHTQCPECQKEADFKKITGNWPLKQNCPNCSAQFYINKEA